MSTNSTFPPGYESQNRGPEVLAVCWTMSAISTIFVVARLYVRGFMMRKLQMDDYFIIAGQVLAYFSNSFLTVSVSYGDGRHFDTLSIAAQQSVLLWSTMSFCPGVLSFGLPKMAVIALLTRVLNPSKYHKWFLWGMGIWLQGTLIATVGTLLGHCTPTASLWDYSIQGKCFSQTALVDFSLYAGAYSAFCDIYLAVYPTVVLYKLKMARKKKLALCGALGIGLFSGAIAIYKTTRVPALADPDFSYATADLSMWTIIEGSTIIMAASIPVLQPLAEKIFKRDIFGTTRKSKSSSTDKSNPQEGTGLSSAEKGLLKPSQKKKKDEWGVTIGGTLMGDGSSQEDILNTGRNGSDSLRRSNSLNDRTVTPPQIMRTDVIEVSYDSRSLRSGRAPPSRL